LFDLDNRSAIVTGAGRGIGKAVALGLAREGADVGLVARSRDELELVAEEIRSLGRRTKVISADLIQIRDLPSIVTEIVEDLGQVDILVNNAGTNIPEEALEVNEENWNRIMDINLKAAFFMA
jgi:2-deoxy-D-gluconate 3-dehydrogenase